MIGLLAHTQMFLAIQNAISDPYIDKVVSLMPFRGLDGNNAFVDRMGKVWTATGTAKLGLGGKFGSGLLLDGGSYIASPPHTDLALGTGDFTIEGWVYPTSNGVSGYNLVFLGTATSFGLYVAGDRKLVFYTGTSYKGTIDVPLNTWTHIAWTRSSGFVNTYVNGIKDVTVASSYNVGSTANTVLGGYPSAAGVIGYIDDFRVTKGVARYTANFTPPNKENYLPSDPYINNVSSLLHFSKDFRDATGRTWTTGGGSPAISATQYKFWGNSLYLNGSSSYISTPNTSDIDLSTGDFTIEAWVNCPLTQDSCLLSKRISGTSGWALETRTTKNVIWRAKIGASWNDFWITTPAGELVADTWTHIALVRKSSTWVMYINGVSKGTITNAGSLANDAAPIRIGSANSAGEDYFKGYIQDLRITKGIARYTKNFTPPNYPHPTDDYFENVVSLLHFDGANGSTTFTDETGRLWNPTAAPTISTAQSKFGGSSLMVTGTNYVSSAALALNTDDFTIETWASLTSGVGTYTQILRITASLLAIRFGDPGFGNKLQVGVNVSSVAQVWSCAITSNSFVNTGFRHIVFQRRAGRGTLFVDGVQQKLNSGANPSTYPYDDFDASTNIPSNIVDIGVGWRGYIDECRITKGIARYSKNFTPPTRPFVL